MNASITTGVSAGASIKGIRADVEVAPVLTYSQNVTFQFLPGREAVRSTFSSPWHLGASSADLPLRFGDQPLRTIGLGQSNLAVRAGALEVGASAANEWWGPGLRTSLVLSNNAAGIPRLYASTSHPVRTRFALISARLFVGELTESPFFDNFEINNTRAASGLLVSGRIAADTNLTVGLSRLVVSPIASNYGFATHVFDALTYWRVNSVANDILPDGRPAQASDQLTAGFVRWIFPASGVEIFGELAKNDLPKSFREFLVAPQSSQAYSLGTQWVRQLRANSRLRIQAEFSYLEQTTIWRDRPPMDFYTGRATAQGFTERGQVLGAAIGPGGSSQFLASDWMAAYWQGGLFLGRTRTENDALYRQGGPRNTQHDVTYWFGARGGRRYAAADVAVEIAASRRLNYLFQSDYLLSDPVIAQDVSNLTLSLRLDPR